MSGRKKSGKEVSIIRSSAAEYLTFVAAVGTGPYMAKPHRRSSINGQMPKNRI